MTDEDGKIIGLMPEQQARTLALKEARLVMRNSPFRSNMPDAMDVYNLARYILTGEDPWAGLGVGNLVVPTETATDAISAPGSTGAGTATEALRTDPEIAVNAVLDAVRLEVKNNMDLCMVPVAVVMRALEDARPVPDFTNFD